MALYLLQNLKEKMEEDFVTKEYLRQLMVENHLSSPNSFTKLSNLINNADDGDTIVLDRDYQYDSTNDVSGIIIDKNLTIIGNGHIIDGANINTGFSIENGCTCELQDLIIQNCYKNGYGGAIDVAWNSTVTINNTNITHNNAEVGGAIDNLGTLTLIDCTFAENTANVDGGAIYNNGGTLTVTNCTFTDNIATRNGGAISNNQGTLTINNSNITNNTANNDGGAINNYKGTFTLEDSIIKNNIVLNDYYYANIYSSIEIIAIDCEINDINTTCYNVKNKIRTLINYIDAPTSAVPNSSYTISAKVTDVNNNPISDIYVDLNRSGYTLYRIRTHENGIASYTGTANNTFTYSMSVEGDNTYESSGAEEKTLTVTQEKLQPAITYNAAPTNAYIDSHERVEVLLTPGLSGVNLTLYKDDVASQTKTTTNGIAEFIIGTGHTVGESQTYYVQFDGNDQYNACTSTTKTLTTAKAPLFIQTNTTLEDIEEGYGIYATLKRGDLESIFGQFTLKAEIIGGEESDILTKTLMTQYVSELNFEFDDIGNFDEIIEINKNIGATSQLKIWFEGNNEYQAANYVGN